jgi:hypothetical protein
MRQGTVQRWGELHRFSNDRRWSVTTTKRPVLRKTHPICGTQASKGTVCYIGFAPIPPISGQSPAFAIVVNEFANGSIIHRPWGAIFGSLLWDTLYNGLLNIGYLLTRCRAGGINPKPIHRAFSYLILCALNVMAAETVAQVVTRYVFDDYGDDTPAHVREMLLIPMLHQLLGEMQDLCASDCRRVMADATTLWRDKHGPAQQPTWSRCLIAQWFEPTFPPPVLMPQPAASA